MKLMGNKVAGQAKIESLLNAYLSSRESLKSSAAETSFHLDEDSLAVFAEGRLSERESLPVISHLVDCGFCRHKTAELVRLELEFAGADAYQPIAEHEPSKISEVLGGLLTKIFGTADSAVFAHNEKQDEAEGEKEDDEATK